MKIVQQIAKYVKVYNPKFRTKETTFFIKTESEIS